jgi:hypothetical protein
MPRGSSKGTAGMSDTVFQGSLFSNDFLRESISHLTDWAELTDEVVGAVRLDLLRIR